MAFGQNSKVALACIDINLQKIVGETTVGTSQNVALCGDGETVAFEASDRQSVRLRHLPTGVERCVIPVQKAKLAFAPDGKVLLTVADNGAAALWDTTNGNKVRDLEGELINKDVRILGISKDGKTIAVLDGGWYSAANVVVWNADTGKRAVRPPGHDGAVTCLAYASGGKLLASGSIDKTVRLWNPATGVHLGKLAVHKKAITAVAFSPDGKLLASSSEDGLIQLSDMTDGKLVSEFAGPSKGATALAFNSKGTLLFAGGKLPEVFAWELGKARDVVRLKTGDRGAVLAFGNGGALALTANEQARFPRLDSEELPERLRVWNPSSSREIAAIPIRPENPDHYGTVHCETAIFSPNGHIIASSQITEMHGIRPSYGHARLRLWERATGQEILAIGPTITKVLAFSRNGRFLASGGTGQSGHLRIGYGSGIDVWDLVTGNKASALPVTPQCLAFSPDGLHLATGGQDHGVLIWNAPSPQAPKTVKVPSAAERETWWAALGGHAREAYKAMWQMADAPEQAVSLLAERVKPAQSADPDAVARLIVKLDSKTYGERAKAQADLEKMGEGAAHLVKQALKENHNLELRRRLERLLRICDATNATSVLGMRQHRAVGMLEAIGTPSARGLLHGWAKGVPGAHLTGEAQAALKRLRD